MATGVTQLRNLEIVDRERERRGNLCEYCGERETLEPRGRLSELGSSLDFHHRRGTTKLFAVGSPGTRSVAAMEAELAKCDLVCRKCHAAERPRCYTKVRSVELRRMVRLYVAGHTVAEVARLVGRSDYCVYRQLRGAGTQMHPLGRRPSVLTA